jgi:hypothetical protein
VLARFQEIIAKRGRNENGAVLKYWRSYGVAGRGGLMTDRDFQVWIDWMVKDRELSEGQLSARQIYTNDLNPFATEGAAAAAASPKAVTVRAVRAD